MFLYANNFLVLFDTCETILDFYESICIHSDIIDG